MPTSSHIMPTYFSQLPIGFEYGKGVWLWDTEGNEYLDSLSGIAVCSLGHAHPAITKAICEQAGKLIHTSNTFQIPLQQKLAARLGQIAGMEQAFFCNSGAEANETAIKMTRMVARKKNIAEPLIIVMDKAFHGRTLATATASSERIRAGFEPLAPGFVYAPFNDMTYLQDLAKTYQNIVAILVEPIQGESGIGMAAPDYLNKIRELCDQQDWLMIVDEVQTGMGRTGRWFNYHYNQILPDVVTVAKALANGVPIGACLARGKACNLFPPGKHGSTFGGNPLACATALTVLRVFEEEKIIENAARIGTYLMQKLQQTLADQKHLVTIRGQGLMIGVELDQPCRDLMHYGIKHRLLFNITADKVIRLLPPLILKQEEADQIALRLRAAIDEFFQDKIKSP